MDNRGEFLNNVAQALGRPLRLEPQAEDAPLNNYANERLTQGAISDWMEARDLPEADGESFRSWFKKHQAQEKKNG